MWHILWRPATGSRLDDDTNGVTSLEYALIAALMMAIVGGAAQSLGAGIAHNLQFAADALSPEESTITQVGGVSSN